MDEVCSFPYIDRLTIYMPLQVFVLLFV